MLTIHRYELSHIEPFETSIFLPFGCVNIIKVDYFNNVPCMWVMVNEESKQVQKRTFRLFQDHHAIPFGYKYIGTISHHTAYICYHVFEKL